MNSEDIENRFIEIEMLCADYESIIKDLNQIVTEQAVKIDRLERLTKSLVKNFDTSGGVKPLSEETPPPHY